MAYLKSNQVKVYPTAHRGQNIDPEAFFTTETNITKSSGSLGLGYKSFIESDGTNLTIVIAGYRFEMTLANVKTAIGSSWNTGSWYAYIRTKPKVTSNSTFVQLVRADSEDTADVLDTEDTSAEFRGLCFASSVPAGLSGIRVFKDGEVDKTSSFIIKTNQIQDGTSNRESSKSLDKSITTEDLVTDNLTVNASTTMSHLTKSQSVSTDGDKKIVSTDLTATKTVTADSGNDVYVLDSFSESSVGAVSMTEKKLPLASGYSAGLVSNTTQSFKGDKTFRGAVSVMDTTESTSAYTGALLVAGGVGIAKKLTVGGATSITDTTASSSSDTGALIVSGGAGIAGNVYTDGTIQSASTITANSGTLGTDATLVGTASRAIGDKDGDDITITYGKSLSVSDASLSLNSKSGDDALSSVSFAISSGLKKDDKTNIAGSVTSDQGTMTFTLGASGATAGIYGNLNNKSEPENKEPGYGGTFNVPYIRVNAKGIITDIGTKTVKIPASDNSNDNTIYDFKTSSNSEAQGTFGVRYKDQGDTSYGSWAYYSVKGLGTSDEPSFFNVTAADVIATSAFNVSSDERLKENIKSYTCEKSILDLDVKEFDYKKDGSHHIGFLAQDVREICPEIVHEDKDGYLMIEESKLVYLLMQEVKELKKKIEELGER